MVRYTDPALNVTYAIPAWGTLICMPTSFGIPAYGGANAYCEHMMGPT
jgi:hypothetical protein